MLPVAAPAALVTHLSAIAPLCRRLGVARLDLFGSASTGAFEPGRSDYDFLVELDADAPGSRAERLIELAEALEALLGAPVDLVNPRYIRNPYFAAEVERTRMPIYA
jgi:predicted nucleotidyltransferase